MKYQSAAAGGRVSRGTTFRRVRLRASRSCDACKRRLTPGWFGWKAERGGGGWAHDTTLCGPCVGAEEAPRGPQETP